MTIPNPGDTLCHDHGHNPRLVLRSRTPPLPPNPSAGDSHKTFCASPPPSHIVGKSAMTLNYTLARLVSRCPLHVPSPLGTTLHVLRADTTLYLSSAHQTTAHATFPLHVQQTFSHTTALWHTITSWAPRSLHYFLYLLAAWPMKSVSTVLVIFTLLVSPVTDKILPDPLARRLCEGAHHFPPRPPSCYTIIPGRLVHDDFKICSRVQIVFNDTKLLYPVVSSSKTLNYSTTYESSERAPTHATNTSFFAPRLCSHRSRPFGLLSNSLLPAACTVLTKSLRHCCDFQSQNLTPPLGTAPYPPSMSNPLVSASRRKTR